MAENGYTKTVSTYPHRKGPTTRVRSSLILGWLLANFLVRQSGLVPALRALSDRELDVLRWLMKGFTNRKIAARPGISIETVRKHVSHTLKKTGTKTRAGLVARALGR
jgi:DNA-binding CsgD family transcriptional regulator